MPESITIQGNNARTWHLPVLPTETHTISESLTTLPVFALSTAANVVAIVTRLSRVLHSGSRFSLRAARNSSRMAACPSRRSAREEPGDLRCRRADERIERIPEGARAATAAIPLEGLTLTAAYFCEPGLGRRVKPPPHRHSHGQFCLFCSIISLDSLVNRTYCSVK